MKQEMAIRRGHVNPAMLDRFAVGGMMGRQRPGTAKDLRQNTDPVRRHVQHHEDSGRQVLGQSVCKLREGLHASRRRPHDNNVTRWHGQSSPAAEPGPQLALGLYSNVHGRAKRLFTCFWRASGRQPDVPPTCSPRREARRAHAPTLARSAPLKLSLRVAKLKSTRSASLCSRRYQTMTNWKL